MSRRHHHDTQAPDRYRIPANWTADFYQWQQTTGADVAVEIKNHGHHLIFVAPGVRCEWWPSTSKIVWDRRFKHATHERDHRRVMAAIERRLPKPRPVCQPEVTPAWEEYVLELART